MGTLEVIIGGTINRYTEFNERDKKMSIPLPTPSVKEIKECIEWIKRLWHQRSLERKIEAAVKGRKSHKLYQFLKEDLYSDYDFLIRNGKIFPVIIIDLPERQLIDPDSLLGKLIKNVSPQIDKKLRKEGQKYISFLQELGRPLKDLPTFCFQSLRDEPTGEKKIDCTIGTYFDALCTCDILEWELLTAVGKWLQSKKGDLRSFLSKKLLLRRYIHGLVKDGDPVLNPLGRSAAIGISTLIVFNRDGEYCVLIGERSSKNVAVHSDLYHVIPSFVFQPVVGEVEKEFSILHNIFREYLEELFGLPEVQQPSSVISYDYFYSNPNLQFLQSLIKKGEAKIFLTGFVINALNLRPEICTLLFIKSPEWYNMHKTGKNSLSRIEFNEEWKKPSEKTKLRPNIVPLKELEKFGLEPWNTAPPGAAAIYLGIEKAKEFGLI